MLNLYDHSFGISKFCIIQKMKYFTTNIALKLSGLHISKAIYQQVNKNINEKGKLSSIKHINLFAR